MTLWRFIETSKDKTYQKITANDSKSYFGYLNKLVGGYNKIYRLSIGK